MKPITARRPATWLITAQSIRIQGSERRATGTQESGASLSTVLLRVGVANQQGKNEAVARDAPARAIRHPPAKAATAYSTALLGGARLPAAGAAAPPSGALLLPRRNLSPLPLRLQDAAAPRPSLLLVKASSDDSSSVSGDELIADLKAKWDAVENKSTVLTYAGGAVVALWLTSVIVGAINSVPLLPKIMELVGLGYTGWFVYRYLLFKESRKELADDIESLKKKIAGSE